jgi:hypothetical protein
MEMDAHSATIPTDKHARLAELELTEEVLRRALGEGLLARLNCTEHHPPAYRGMVAWGESVRALRDGLATFGWAPSNEGNSAMVVNQLGDTGIQVVLGDAGTGDVTKNVSTKYARGPKTFQHVRTNATQLSLLPGDDSVGDAVPAAPQRLWMLLHYLDPAARELRCELSLPIRIGDDARPDVWQERIVLEPIPIDGDELILPIDSDLVGPEIDIVVEKRG